MMLGKYLSPDKYFLSRNLYVEPKGFKYFLLAWEQEAQLPEVSPLFTPSE